MTDATVLDTPAETRGEFVCATARRSRVAHRVQYRDRLPTTVSTGVEAHVRAVLPAGG